MICIICKNQKTAIFTNIKQKKYWKCSYCEAIFLDKEFYLSSNDEYKHYLTCLLYTSDAADDSLRVDLGGRRII